MPNTKSVLIRGEGVAACCCARLLGRSGLRFTVAAGARPKAPAILMGEQTQKLLGDVFEAPHLFAAMPRIRRRIVMWGDDAKALTLPHEAVLSSDEALLEALRPHAGAGEPAPAQEPDWTIYAGRPLPPGLEEIACGSRMAEVSPVRLEESSDREACQIESLDEGWLFLMPGGARGWLVSVGAPAAQALAESRMIAGQIASLEPSPGSFPTHARIADPLCGPRWLACGTAALGFDPLSGDGTGNATREAILASAVAAAVLEGKADPEAALAHYRARLHAGFQRHLEVSREFYRTGGRGDWWKEQVAALDRGIAWCKTRLESVTGFRYRLVGFTLEEIGAA